MPTDDKARRVAVELLGWPEHFVHRLRRVVSDVEADWIIAGLALENLAEEGWALSLLWARPGEGARHCRAIGKLADGRYHSVPSRSDACEIVDAILTAACAVLDARGGRDTA